LAVKPIKYGISAAIGIGHVATLFLDEKQEWTEPFKRASDYSALIGFGAGLVIDALDIEDDIGEALALSSLPLLTRSIYEAVRHYVGGGGAKKRKVVARKGRWKMIKEGRVVRAVKEEEEQAAPTVVPSPLVGL